MKIKILALILAVFCLSTLFVGCDQKCTPHADENADLICDNCEEALQAPACKPHVDENKDYVCDNCPETFIKPCETHKDENADKHCDVCGLAVVTITEIVEPKPEDRVDMVVNPLPENGNLSDFIKYEDASSAVSSVLATIEGNLAGINYFAGYAYYTAEDKYTMTVEGIESEVIYTKHFIVNLKTGEKIFETSNLLPGGALKTFVGLALTNYYYVVNETYVTTDENGAFVDANVFQYKAYDGTVLFDVVEAYENITDWALPVEYVNNGVRYSVFDNTVYAFDSHTGAFINKMDKVNLVHRPDFDATTEKYGYVELNNSIFVYDLTKWVECVYSYTVPSFYENAEFFMIDNDRILVQAAVKLLDNAISYDVIEGNSKYDIVYLVIDPTAKTETAVEFGYYIEDVDAASEWGIDNKDLNVVEAYPIVNDRIDYNNELILVADKDLKISLCLEDDNFSFVTANTLLVREEISENLFVRKLVNAADGTLIAYVPDNAVVYDDFILYDGKIYDFTMTVVLDPVASGYYAIDNICDDFVLLVKEEAAPTEENPDATTIKHYVFTAKDGAKEIAVEQIINVYNLNGIGYVVAHKVAALDENGQPIANVVYTLYSVNSAEAVLESDTAIIYAYALNDGVHVVADYSGNTYLVK